MECYRVRVPDGIKVPGVTADGSSTTVLPGEYLVHPLGPKIPSAETVLRWVGADPLCRDVHVRPDALRQIPASEGVTLVPWNAGY
jgi:hypothetical protein